MAAVIIWFLVFGAVYFMGYFAAAMFRELRRPHAYRAHIMEIKREPSVRPRAKLPVLCLHNVQEISLPRKRAAQR